MKLTQPTPQDHGATGDGKADDTVALQAFVDEVTTRGRSGVIPAGTYRVTAPILVPNRPGWAVHGEHRESVRIVQDADGVPILNLGGAAGPALHSYELSGITFDYTRTQSDPGAVPVLVSQMPYQGTWRNLTFARGHYATAVAPGIGAPWGHTFDDITFASGLTGGAFDWSKAVNGVPNNRFGRLYVDAQNMAGTVLHLRGYNFTVDTIEIIASHAGARLFHLAPGGLVDIGTLKVENGTHHGGRLFEFDVNSYARIGHLTITGHTMRFPEGTTYAVHAGAGARVQIGKLRVEPTEVGGRVFAIGGTGNVTVNTLARNTLVDGLTNVVSASTAERVTVAEHANNRLSRDLGDADYQVRLGDPALLAFETQFTAPRVVDLPASNEDLFNGLTYTVFLRGATNGANTATIRCGDTTLHTHGAGSAAIGFTYRRDAGSAARGWTLTRHEQLP